MRILVVDDDAPILQLVTIHLEREGYKVEQAQDAEAALHILEEHDVDLAVVDVMMPGMSGVELTKLLTNDLRIPVILLTAKGQLADKEKGFLAGAEDYIVKPFEPKELVFRVSVVLRRNGRSLGSLLTVGNVMLNRQSFDVTIAEHTLIMPLKEFELLSILMARAGKVTERSLLIEQTWGPDYEGNELTLNTHMNRIRDRLKKYGANVEISTIRGIGYKLEECI